VTRSFSFLILAGLVLAAASEAHAQPARRSKDSNKPAAAPAPDALPPGEMRVKAESYEEVEKGRWQARGLVDLRVGDLRIQADQADVFEDTQPDGTVKRRMVAEGNVVFIRGEERLAGDRVEMDDTGHGFFTNAVGYVEPGVYVEGRRVERVDDKTYKVEGGKFTSCAQPNPRWKFTASKAKIEVGDKIIATNAFFEVKGVPTLYFPYIYYPIRKDGRSTGFLIPHVGYSSTRGYTVGTAFFWAMGRSLDQTFYADYYSKVGFGFGHELRYMETSPSRGSFRTYLFNPSNGGSLQYDLDWNALQMLPGGARASLQVRRYSDLLFQQNFQNNFNYATNRSEIWSATVEKDFRQAILSAYTQTSRTYFGDTYQRVNGRNPGVSLRRFPRQVGWGGIVFGLEANADSLVFGNQVRVDRYARADFAPVLSRPFSLSFLDLTPQVGYRYTRYGASTATQTIDDTQISGIFGPAIDRQFFEAQVDLRGPTFSRVFDTPGFSYTDRVKHTIGPEISWMYRTRVDNFNVIPKFDGDDYYLGTNQISFALAQRFFAKRRSPSGKKVPYEFFNWRLMQTYYVQIAEGQNNFDPNYSSSAFGPGYQPEHLSPLMSRMRLRPTPDFSTDFTLEYDVNFKQVRRTSISEIWNEPRFNLTGGWSRSVRLSVDPTQRLVAAESLRGAAVFDLVPKRFSLEGSADYDMVNRMLWHVNGLVRYSVQCCGFSVEYIRYNWNGRQERQWQFKLELANIGSMGNFMSGGGGMQGGGRYP